MQIDHEYRTSKNNFQYNQYVLTMLRSHRDDAIIEYKNKSDVEIKVLVKADFKYLSKLYTDNMAEVCNNTKKDSKSAKRIDYAIFYMMKIVLTILQPISSLHPHRRK